MAATTTTRRDGAADARRDRTTTLIVAAVAALLLFQFGDIAFRPIQIWDEARLAVNAAEMVHTGERLATTYGWQPDLWNTKPPLAINLMAESLQLFGFNAFALRLPSALAACLTVALVAWYVRRITGSLSCGLAAALLLAASSGFYGVHAGQTGDYDALLTLLTTAYAFALFDLIESERPRALLAAAAGLLIGLAILTKGVAGIIPGVGIAAYALLFAPRRLIGGARDVAIVVGVAILVGGSFYAIRAGQEPRFLAAVAANEMGGRYGRVLDGHEGPPWGYLKLMVTRLQGSIWPLFSASAAALLGLAAPWLLTGRARRFAILAVCQVAGVFIIYSTAATKLAWYVVPALPFLAMLLALTGWGRLHKAQQSGARDYRLFQVTIAIALALVLLQAVVGRYVVRPDDESGLRRFDRLIEAAERLDALPLAVLDHGVVNQSALMNYAPSLRFYALAAARDGQRVDHVTSAAQAGRFVGSCDPSTRDAVAALGRGLWEGDGCVLIAR